MRPILRALFHSRAVRVAVTVNAIAAVVAVALALCVLGMVQHAVDDYINPGGPEGAAACAPHPVERTVTRADGSTGYVCDESREVR